MLRAHGRARAGLRAFFASVLVALVALLLSALLAACGESAPSAASVLAGGQTKFDATHSFHFKLTTDHAGAPTDANSIYPTAAEGDAQLPDTTSHTPAALSASATVAAGGIGSVTTQVVVIGNEGWFLNPLTNKYEANDQIGVFSKVFDPQTGIASLLTQIDSASTPAGRNVGGNDCWNINGMISADKVAGIVGNTAASSAPLKATICVGKNDHELYLISLTGVLLAGDVALTDHQFLLSKFDVPVSITRPAGV